MPKDQDELEPDWDTPLSLGLTPEAIVHALFATADTVHTGVESCVDNALVLADVTALQDQGDNHCRMAEQEYVESEESNLTWRDWTVELKLDGTYVAAHWRSPTDASPAEWEWCAEQAESAFKTGCVLVGRRVRRGLVIEDLPQDRNTARTHH